MTKNEYILSVCAYPYKLLEDNLRRIDVMLRRNPSDDDVQEYFYYIYLNTISDSENIMKKLKKYANKKSKADKFTIKFVLRRYNSVVADISLSKRSRSEKTIFVINKN